MTGTAAPATQQAGADAAATAAAAADSTTSTQATSTNTGPTGVAFGDPAKGSSDAPAESKTTETNVNDPWAGLSADNRAIVDNKKWKSPDDAIKSYSELEKAHSQRPAFEAPKSLGEYEFAKPDNADTIGYSDQFANNFREWAYEAKLPKEAAKVIHDKFVAYASQSLEAQMTKTTENVLATKTELTQAWGPEGTPQFNRNVQLAARAADKFGVMDALKDAGFIVDANGIPTIAHAGVAKMLAQVGQALFSEDTLHGDATTTANPFDPKSENLELQAAIYKADPQKAKALIYAANQQDNARYAYLLKQIK